MGWVKEGFMSVTDKPDDNVRLRLRNHTAFDSILHGDATPSDLNALVAMSNMTTALARKHGADWRMEIRAAADAVEAMQARYARWRKIQGTQPELDAIRMLLRIHDAQLDACNVADIDEGIRVARKGVAAV